MLPIPINVTVVGFPPEHPLAAMEFRADIANTTIEQITIRKVSLCLPPAINEARGAKKDTCELFNCSLSDAKCQADSTLPIGQEHVAFHRMGSHDEKEDLWNRALLLFRAGSYDYRAMVEFDAKDGTTRRVYGAGKLDLKAPFVVLLFGAWSGALLAALFYFAFQIRTQWAAGASLPPLDIGKTFVKSLVFALAGIVPSLIAVLLIARIQDVPLPMNVSVNDFFGGIILGLGSYPLGDWLFKKIFP